jgi:hypothetical protein
MQMFQKYLSFLLLAIWRWNSDRGNSIFIWTFCGAWLNKVKVDWFEKLDIFARE